MNGDAVLELAVRAWSGLEGYSALGDDWDACAREAELDPLCNGHAWTLSYARAFVPPGDALGWTFSTDAGRVAGLIALRREPPRGALALRRALFLADGTFDSDYLEPPVRPGLERAVARQLIDAARGIAGLEALVFAGLPAESRFLHALRAELDQRGLPRREHAVPCLSAALPDSFSDYVATLPSRMRSKVRSSMRAVREQGARLVWCEGAAELDARLEELFHLHELRWRAAGKPGSFADARRRAFYREIARSSVQLGTLRFARLEQDGRTLASQFGVQLGPRYYQIQEGFDPALEGGRVGIALRGLAIEHLIGLGARHYDFMAGDSRHKREWGGELRPCTTIAFPLPRWRARLVYGLLGWIERWRARRPAPTPASVAAPAEDASRETSRKKTSLVSLRAATAH